MIADRDRPAVHHRVAVSGGALAVTEQGSGSDVVLLLHGFAMDQRLWAPQIPALRARFRVVTVDLRGFGGSTAQTPLAGHADDVVAVLDALDLGRAHLVGLSLGANVALQVAVAHPSRVDRMALLSPGLTGHRWTSPRPPDEVAAVAAELGAEAAKQRWRSHALFDPVRAHPRAWALVSAMIDSYDAGAWRGEPVARPLPDAATALATVAAPTLVVNGLLDLPGYLEVGERIAREVPSGARRVIAGAGHVVNLEAPEAVTTELSRFFPARTRQHRRQTKTSHGGSTT